MDTSFKNCDSLRSYAGLRSERLEKLSHQSRKQIVKNSIAPQSAGMTTANLALKSENSPKGSVVGAGQSNIKCQQTVAPASVTAEYRPKTKGGVHRLYAGRDTDRYFCTSWRLGPDGRRMGLYVARNGGFANLDASPDNIDIVRTYKKEKTRNTLFHLDDHIINKRFVTSNEHSLCTDVLKPLGYRGAPTGPAPYHVANPKPQSNPGKANNLDHRLWPYKDAPVRIIQEGSKAHPLQQSNQQRSHICPSSFFLTASREAGEMKEWRTKRRIAAPWTGVSPLSTLGRGFSNVLEE